ncbi:MAG TPA: DUF2142 domain-containing protein [Mycobacteriales bacterium]|nr:DUF2142 domain-containing protein [Mycobacteriales bacterium]
MIAFLRTQISRRAGIVGFLCLFALIGAWSFATPLFGGPDEPAHTIKAAATAHGHFLGSQAPHQSDAWIDFRIPATIGDAATRSVCFAFHPDQSAGCEKPFVSRSGSQTASTYVGRYPPLYYLLVGLPSLVLHSPGVLYLMRLASAALGAAFLAMAFVSGAASRHGRGAVIGAALAITPMVVFLSAVLNPSGLEIAAALCFWVSALVLFTDPEHPARRGLILRAALGAAVFMQTRGLSPLLLAIAGIAVAIIAGWSTVVGLLRRRDIQIALGVLAVIGAGTLAWIFGARSLALAPVGYPVQESDSNLHILGQALKRCLRDLKDMIGMFGWKDTPPPLWSTLVWVVLLFVVVAAAIVTRARRGPYVLPALCIVIVLLPALLSAANARQDGLIGQARYLMPVAVGIPVIACFLLLPRLRAGRWLTGAVWTVAGATAVVQAAAFVQALRRYRGGAQSPLLRRTSEWAPPAGTLLTLAFFAVALLAYTLWWRSLAPVAAATDAAVPHIPAEPARLQTRT